MRRVFRSVPVLVYLVALGFFLLTCSGMMHGGDGTAQIKAAMQLVATGSPGFAIEPDDELFLHSPNGRFYEAHDLGNVLLMVPACGIVHLASLDADFAKPLFMLSNCFYSALGPVFIYLAGSLFHSKRNALFLAALFVFATPFGAFARASWDVLGGTVCVSAYVYALFALLRDSGDKTRQCVGLGLALGMTGMFRYSMLPFLTLTTCAYLFLHRKELGLRRILLLGVAFLAVMLPTFYYNYVRMGSPLLAATMASKFLDGPNHLEAPLPNFPLLVFSPNWGMLFFCPMLLLLLLSPKALQGQSPRVKQTFVWLLIGHVIYMWFIAKLANWTGVVGWGSRYMVLLYPSLLLLLSFVLFDMARPWRRVAWFAVGVTLLLNLPIPFVNWQYVTKYNPPGKTFDTAIDNYHATQPRQQVAVWRALLRGLEGEPNEMAWQWENQPRLRTIAEFPDNWLVRMATFMPHGMLVALILAILLLAGLIQACLLLWSAVDLADTETNREPPLFSSPT